MSTFEKRLYLHLKDWHRTHTSSDVTGGGGEVIIFHQVMKINKTKKKEMTTGFFWPTHNAEYSVKLKNTNNSSSLINMLLTFFEQIIKHD